MEIKTNLYAGKIQVKFLGPTDDMPNRHIYMVNGKRKTGVTTIIQILDKSQQLMQWAVDLAVDYLRDLKDITEKEFYEASIQHTVRKQKAADIGDLVHNWIEGYIKGEKVALPAVKEAQIGINAFLDWEKGHKVKFLSSERVIYSKKHDFIGKMDIEAKVDGKHCLIDIKTSSGVYNSYNLQTAAYVMADEEERKVKYAQRWIIRLAKETEDEYNDRMIKKNESRARKGKDNYDYPVYKVFEAVNLDEGGPFIDRDFKAFLSALKLYRWNQETGFYQKK